MAANWLTRSGMYAGALLVSFEHGGSAELLLSALAGHLALSDGAFRPDEPQAALVMLQPRLRAAPTLLIADNLESILPDGDAPLETGERTELWDVLLALREAGCGLLLTSRNPNLGDGRLAEGRLARHLALGGLLPSDAYALATRLLDDLGIDRERAPYSLLKRLRGLPEANDAALEARFIARYSALAHYLYNEDGRNPYAVRALVCRELSNLRRAFDLVVAAGDADAAADLADSIGKFLGFFGHGCEWAELLRRVAALARYVRPSTIDSRPTPNMTTNTRTRFP